MAKYSVGIVWKEIVEHYAQIEIDAENEAQAQSIAEDMNDRGEIEDADWKVIDREHWSGPDYDVEPVKAPTEEYADNGPTDPWQTSGPNS